MSTENPLLDLSGLPRFDEIAPAHIAPAVEQVLAESRSEIDRILRHAGEYTWASLVEPLEAVSHRLDRVWSPVRHLHSVADEQALREAYNACLPLLSEFHTELGHNIALQAAFRTLADGPEFPRLSSGQQRLVNNALRDFHLSGVDLPGPEKERFKAISRELTELGSRFQQNLLDATKAWTKVLIEESTLSGLPESALALARHTAEREGAEGYVLTLEPPSYLSVMTYAHDRELRREVYEAYVTRASELGPHAGRWDNSAIMEDIVRLRHELAALVGYDSYAHYSLAKKMAHDPTQVFDFLTELAQRTRPVAENEYRELAAFARDEDGLEGLQAWDIPYYSERLRQSRYELSQEDLRPYFPAPHVLEGLFLLVRRLFGVEIEATGGAQTWHPDVLFFTVRDPDGPARGQFYLDLYARPQKRAGAWMDQCVGRRRTSTVMDNPVAYVNCNFPPPVGGQPSMMTHQDVLTLFHEFGHALHHLLTRIDHPSIAGINGVEWDAVELPSQLMENWCWEREALDLFARHHESAEGLPDALLERMQAARHFQSGMQMIRQLEFALFDFRLYADYEPRRGARVLELMDEVRQEVAVVVPPPWNRFANSFTHIFSGGYAAGYYSYKWAEVLSADAFSRFEEDGVLDGGVGSDFLHAVLEQGGSRPALESFVAFRGREPRIDALLRHSGIAA